MTKTFVLSSCLNSCLGGILLTKFLGNISDLAPYENFTFLLPLVHQFSPYKPTLNT
jgi:hypothetical protein